MIPLFNEILRYNKVALKHVIIKEKCGIECLHMKPGTIYNLNGSYGNSELTCNQLRKILRDNGARGYGRFNKLEVVKMLIKL